MKSIKRINERVACETRYGVLFDDIVEAGDGQRGSYLRWEWRSRGVVVVPVSESRFALGRHYRYPISGVSLEFPRGGGEKGESAADTARRELIEEFGLQAGNCVVVGKIHADTGLIANALSVVRAEVSANASSNAKPEIMESIDSDVIWLDKRAFLQAAVTGDIRCAITLAAFLLASV